MKVLQKGMDETNGTKRYKKMKCLDASKAKKNNG